MFNYETISIINYIGIRGPKECGYCKNVTQYSDYLHCSTLTCRDYQVLIERSIKRCGHIAYKIVRNSCCIAYAIRCNALKCSIKKSQKKIIKKFHNFIVKEGGKPVEKKKGKYNQSRSFQELMDEIVDFNCLDDDKLHVIPYLLGKYEELPGNVFEESFYLYNEYQKHTHSQDVDHQTREVFQSLLKTCLQPKRMEDNYFGIRHYGSYLLQYRYRDHLLAISLVDILPKYISSVYFCYNPDFKTYGLGNLSALIELRFIQILNEHLPDLKYYTLGLYIKKNRKMVDKENFSPSELLCPITYEWIPFELCNNFDLTVYQKLSPNQEPFTNTREYLIPFAQRHFAPFQASPQKLEVMLQYIMLVGLKLYFKMIPT